MRIRIQHFYFDVFAIRPKDYYKYDRSQFSISVFSILQINLNTINF